MIGKILRDLRTENHYGQKDIAKYINKSVQAYSQYELKKRVPDIGTLIKLSKFYNVSVDYLLGITNVRNTAPEISEDVLKIDVSNLSQNAINKIIDYSTMVKVYEADMLERSR